MKYELSIGRAGWSLSDSLKIGGPRLDVCVSLQSQQEARLREQQLEIPSPYSGKALLDTGTKTTQVEKEVLNRLGLKPKNGEPVYTSGTQTSSERKLYGGVCIAFSGTGFPAFPIDEVTDDHLVQAEIIVLIGRDILQQFQLVYDGISGKVILELPER